jgi:hypothetical protein
VIQANLMRKLSLRILFLWMLPTTAALAGARHFTFLYEAPTSAPGSIESENWITWQRVTNPERSDQIGFRHEIEIGVTDRLQASIYFVDWSYARDRKQSTFNYSGSAIELIYNLTNPVIDPVGLSIYGEISGGRQHFELESKLIAQKNFGPLILDYNLTLEAEWEEHGLQEHRGEMQQALGASYELSPRISVGLEFLHEFVFPDWRDEEKIRNVFVGPNVAFRHQNWFVTVAALAQATCTPDEADFKVRTIFGFGF